MKVSNLMLFTLLVLVGFCSCEKDSVKPSKSAVVEINPLFLKEGGDDDEDPIIQGHIFDDGILVDTVTTSIIPAGSQIPIRTTTDNSFQEQVPNGTYFFEITPEGEDPVTTGNYVIDDDVEIRVYLDSI
jgi:hypothetical protein